MRAFVKSLLKSPAVSRTRRNHGLEHATIHILSRKFPGRRLAGHSDPGGFWLWGDVPTEAVHKAVKQALERLRSGEHHLAIHPNCGTNFVISGILAGVMGALAMLGVGRRWRDKLERLRLAMSLATLALIFAQPLGFFLQEHVTTSGLPENLEVIEIQRLRQGRLNVHRVVTRG